MSPMIEISNRDGLPIRADLHRPEGEGPFPLVLVAHGFKGFKDWGFFPHLAEELAGRGLAALRFNFARNGVGEDPLAFDRLDLFRENSLSRELCDLEDLLSALPEFEGVDPSRLGLFGHSRGGGIALLFAAGETRIRSLVTWAAVARFDRFFTPAVLEDWKAAGEYGIVNARTGQTMPLGMDLHRDLTERIARFDVERAAKDLQAPHLIIHGTQDEAVPSGDAEQIHGASEGRANLLMVEGAGHTFGAVHPFAGTTEELTRAVNATADHFQSTL